MGWAKVVVERAKQYLEKEGSSSNWKQARPTNTPPTLSILLSPNKFLSEIRSPQPSQLFVALTHTFTPLAFLPSSSSSSSSWVFYSTILFRFLPWDGCSPYALCVCTLTSLEIDLHRSILDIYVCTYSEKGGGGGVGRPTTIFLTERKKWKEKQLCSETRKTFLFETRVEY